MHLSRHAALNPYCYCVQCKDDDVFLPLFQIANVLDSHAATLQRKADREVFFMNTQSIVQLVQRLVFCLGTAVMQNIQNNTVIALSDTG